ncbi:MAG: hypothetical protein ACRDBO_00080 [Lachnospiraceae bacterium]
MRQKAYQLIRESADRKKIDKIADGIEAGKITKENFWDSIRKFTKNVYSDHSIGRWQIISEWFYEQLN